ncbi:MAG: NAD-dependent epimerase/dehydratase family protein [Smithella sp.]|nr:NAD-dependent epimerase/dehydratase family protein [Smithella sp.]
MTAPRALIAGITGMVGSRLTDFLLANTDWDIYGMCRWRSPLDNVEHLLDSVNKKDRIYFIDGDLCDYISLQNAVDECSPDYVFHLAAQSYPKTKISGTDNNHLLLSVLEKKRAPGFRGLWANAFSLPRGAT